VSAVQVAALVSDRSGGTGGERDHRGDGRAAEIIQLVAVTPELQLAVDDEMLVAQDMKCLVRRADIGRSFFDNASQLLETPRRAS
jgi:hypothetical protein